MFCIKNGPTYQFDMFATYAFTNIETNIETKNLQISLPEKKVI